MSLVITTEQILARICVFIDANLTVSTNVIYPGESADIESFNDWIEVRAINFNRMKSRRGNKDLGRCEIEIDIFGKFNTERYKYLHIAKNITSILLEQNISLLDYNTSGTPTVGNLRLHEPTRDTKSRAINNKTRTDAKMLTMVFPCVYQED